LPDVVQQTGQIGFFRVWTSCGNGNLARQFGHHQGVPPESGKIGRGNAWLTVKQVLNRQAGGDRADQTRTQAGQTVVEAVQFTTPAQGRGIGDSQQAGRQTGILADQAGQFGDGRSFVVGQMDQAQENLRR